MIFTPGWTAGARTIASLAGDGVFTFSVGPSVGIVCGLNNQDNDPFYTELDFAFYINGSTFRVIENGVFKTTAATFSSEAVFKITRFNGVVRYYVDAVLRYTSLNRSYGVVFGDCSLYAFMDAVLNATILDSSPSEEYNSGSADCNPVRARGISGASNWGFADCNPVVVVGTELEVARGLADCNPVIARGSSSEGADGANWGVADCGPVVAFGQDVAVVPEFNAGLADCNPVYVFGYEGVLDTNYGVADCNPVLARGHSGGSGNWGHADCNPVVVVGYGYATNALYAEWPPWLVSSTLPMIGAMVFPQPLLAGEMTRLSTVGAMVFPQPVLVGYGGATGAMEFPASVLVGTATSPTVAWGAMEFPEPVLTGTMSVGTVAEGGMTFPRPILAGYGGARGAMVFPRPVLTSTATNRVRLHGAMTFPRPVLLGSAEVRASLRGAMVFPVPTLRGGTGNFGRMVFPVPLLYGVLSAVSTATDVTYAVNTTTGAVTRWAIEASTKLITAHGHLYVLRGTTLYRVDDTAAAISATVQTASNDFSDRHRKRLSELHVWGRELAGVTLTLVQDEQKEWRYQIAGDVQKATGAHRVSLRAGVKFHTCALRFQNRLGGKMDLGGLELPFESTSRR